MRSSAREKALKEVKIHWDRQNEHISGSHNFEKNKGVIKIGESKLEQLLMEKAGKGQKVIGSEPFTSGYVERVDFGQYIGDFALRLKNGESEFIPTTKGIIKHSKDGIHVIPSNPEAIIK